MVNIHEPHAHGGVPDEVLLGCLVNYPEGTRGHREEVELLKLLNRLCKEHGYGRLSQLARWIEDIWMHPGKVEAYRKASAQTQELLKQHWHSRREEGGKS